MRPANGVLEEDAARSRGAMTGTKLLIVDDEADFQALVQSWLEDDGYEVYSAANGWEGLASIDHHGCSDARHGRVSAH